MAKDLGFRKVEFEEPMTDEELAEDTASYTVPIPEGLTGDFNPSKPVTDEQTIAWACRGIEPYPGYAEEFAAWEDAWEMVNRAQMEADGNTPNYVDNLDL